MAKCKSPCQNARFYSTRFTGKKITDTFKHIKVFPILSLFSPSALSSTLSHLPPSSPFVPPFTLPLPLPKAKIPRRDEPLPPPANHSPALSLFISNLKDIKGCVFRGSCYPGRPMRGGLGARGEGGGGGVGELLNDKIIGLNCGTYQPSTL